MSSPGTVRGGKIQETVNFSKNWLASKGEEQMDDRFYTTIQRNFSKGGKPRLNFLNKYRFEVILTFINLSCRVL